MERREAYLLLSVLTLALMLAFVFVPRTEGQRERNTCRRDCTKQYRECVGATDAGEDECRKALDECRDVCAGKRPKSAAKSAAEAEDNTNTNSNDNNNDGGANTNDDANSNSISNPHHGGHQGPPRAPDNRNSNRPPA